MKKRKLTALVSALFLSWNIAAPIPLALASEADSIEVESMLPEQIDWSYSHISYDGTDQLITIDENIELHLVSWKDDTKQIIVAKVYTLDAQGQKLEYDIELKVNDERTAYPLDDERTIYLASREGEAFSHVDVIPEVVTEEFMPIEINENGAHKDQLALIDEHGIVLEWKDSFEYFGSDNAIISEEEYIALHTEIAEDDEIVAVEDNDEIAKEEESIEESVEEFTEAEEVEETPSPVTMMRKTAVVPGIVYSTHVEHYGWLKEVKNGVLSGTEGQAKRIEALKIRIDGIKDLGVEYATHVQSSGWQNYVSDFELSGTSGVSKRVEALRIRLTGKQAANYDVYYRVHTQNYGWLDWAKNGESAGTAGLAKRIEAIEIRLVKKGDKAPGASIHPFVEMPSIQYASYVNGSGWQTTVGNGKMSGTQGQKKSLEAIRVGIPTSGAGIRYRTHMQGQGWMPWTNADTVNGLPGSNKRLEAIQLQLTGPIAKQYDIYYRIHAQKFGWLGWAKNGELAGTEGYGYQAESYEVRVVPKGTSLDQTKKAYEKKDYTAVVYSSHVEKIGWMNSVRNGATSGTLGQALRVEALNISLAHDQFSGSIEYRTHVQSHGWMKYVSNGTISGTTGQQKRVEAIQIKLTGEIADKYDVYYRTHVQGFGWLGWARNGMSSGSEGLGKRLESIQIKLIEKGMPGPTVLEEEALKVPDKKKVIFLDVGHGGSDPGAQYYGVNEKDLNLQIAKKLKADLEKAGYIVIMSRTGDTYMDYKTERSRVANNSGADIFISLHNNAMPGNSYVSGIETFYYEYDPDYQPRINKAMHNNPDRIAKSAVLANAIQKNLISSTGAVDRKVQRDTFAVLRETALPAVLVEFGFMSNPNELAKLQTNSYQHTLSKAVTKGINTYFQTY